MARPYTMPGVLPFSSHGAARVEQAVLDLAHERIPLPLGGIADADGVDVRVVDDHLRTVADAPDGVAHPVEAHLVEAELAHLGLDALADRADLRVHRGDGADVAHEVDDVVALLLDALLDLVVPSIRFSPTLSSQPVRDRRRQRKCPAPAAL